MDHIFLSIIIPCYNSSKYLKHCMQSLFHQTFGLDQLEIILIDDASSDDTKEKIQLYEKEYTHLVKAIYFKENKRQGAARNAGLAIATGTYIFFLDSDDWVGCDMCQILYDKLVNTQIEMVQFSHYDVYQGQNTYIGAAVIPGELQIEDSQMRKLFLMAQVLTCGSQTKVYKREFLIKAHAKFPEKLIYEEPYFVYPLLFEVTKILSLKEALYFCRIHAQSTMQSIAKEKNRLQEHAIVQRLLFEKMKEKVDVYAVYKDEIEYYFLTTYYIEMLVLSGTEKKEIELPFFEQMQAYIKETCMAWKDNFYLKKKENETIKEIIDTVYQSYTKETLQELCKKTALRIQKMGED